MEIIILFVLGQTSYHFIPFFYSSPYYHSHHYTYGSTRRSSTTVSPLSTTSMANTTQPPPELITKPIIYNLDSAFATDMHLIKPSLVVAVNNMVVYGEMQPDEHIVIVINEEYEDPGEIPDHFLLPPNTLTNEDEEMYILPSKRTTTVVPLATFPTTEQTILDEKMKNTTTGSSMGSLDVRDTLNNRWYGDGVMDTTC